MNKTRSSPPMKIHTGAVTTKNSSASGPNRKRPPAKNTKTTSNSITSGTPRVREIVRADNNIRSIVLGIKFQTAHVGQRNIVAGRNNVKLRPTSSGNG